MSAACLEVQGFNGRIEQSQHTVDSMQQQVSSLTKAVQLSTECADERASESSKTQNKLGERTTILETKVESRSREQELLNGRINDMENRFRDAEKFRVEQMERMEQNHREDMSRREAAFQDALDSQVTNPPSIHRHWLPTLHPPPFRTPSRLKACTPGLVAVLSWPSLASLASPCMGSSSSESLCLCVCLVSACAASSARELFRRARGPM